MSIEPGTTSLCYDPLAPYTAPVGRLPVLGKVRAEIDQIRAAIANDTARTANEVLKIAAEVAALEVEKDKVAAEVLRIGAEKLRIDAEILALGVEREKLLVEKDRISAEILLMGVQSSKVAAEKLAIEANVINENTRTINDTTRATNEVNRTVGELQELVNKTAAEVGLLDQKKQTELAQVSDTVSTGSVAGIVGKQKTLFQKQAAGFDRDAEQKLAKIMVDAWSVTATVAGEADPATAGLDNTSIASVMTLAKAGITPPP